MIQHEFVATYRRDARPLRNPTQLQDEAHAWSSFFGEVLHDHMSGIRGDQAGQAMYEYIAWYNDSFVAPYRLAAAGRPGPLGNSLDNRYAFHNLNAVMQDEWHNVPPDKIRRHLSITNTQAMVALSGLTHYGLREQMFSTEQRGGPQHPQRGIIEGILNEHDAAIVLLEIKRRNPAIKHVVPGPQQFEQQAGSANADFIVLTDDRADGIQLKSRVRKMDEVTHYDPKRIMLIDADRDFGNILAKKLVGKSAPQVMTWGGLICAQFIDGIKTQGRDSYLSMLSGPERRVVMQNKFLARSLVRGIKSNFADAVLKIEARLLPRLGIERQQAR